MKDESLHIRAYETIRTISDLMHGFMFHPNPYILLVVKELLAENCKVYLEIGSFCGGSLCCVMSSEYTTDFYAIDSCLDFFMPPDLEKVIRNNCTQYKLFYTPFEQPLNIEFCLKENARLFNRHHHSSTLLKGDSRSPSTLNQIKTLLTDGIDLFFIDGGHDYQNVIDDFENYFPFINSNGVIVFDDYHSSHNDVITAVDDICYKYKEKIYTIGCIDNIVYSKSIHSSIPCYILQKK